jgi:hypothetical protein
MGILDRLIGMAPLAGAVLLASCGGGGDSAGQPSQQASPGVIVGQPAPAAITIPAELFVARARAELCAGIRNRLFIIDARQVFWDRAGNCGDNGYAQRLYGATPDALLCEAADTIAGPRTSCADPLARAMFDTILNNLYRPDLGLGPGHKVELLAFEPGAPVALAMQDLDRNPRSQVSQPTNAVVRDAAAFAALWSAHAGAMPAPQVDFGRFMVIGVFMGSRENGCYATGIDSVVRADGKVTVSHTDTEPGPGVMCTLAIVSPAHLVMVERSEAPVEFLAQRKALK